MSKRLLSRLAAETYQADTAAADRAVRAFGDAAAQIAAGDAEYVRGHLRRLFWLVNDESGGICLRAPEMIGEVIARCPGMFDEFISPLAYLLDMEPEDAARFRPGILIALLRIAEQRPQAVMFALPLVRACVEDTDPQVRELTIRIITECEK